MCNADARSAPHGWSSEPLPGRRARRQEVVREPILASWWRSREWRIAAHGHDWVTQVRAELLDCTGMVVLRHVHLLNARQVRMLAGALEEARSADACPRVTVTLNQSAARAGLAGLLRLFPAMR